MTTACRLKILKSESDEVFSSISESHFRAAFELELIESPPGELRGSETSPCFFLGKDGDDWILDPLSHPEWKPLSVDYTRGPQAERLKKAWLSKELLKDALSFRKGDELWVVDGTAGLLGDATLLATWGHHVIAFEQNPALCFLGLRALDKLEKSGQKLDVELHCLPFSSGECAQKIRERTKANVDRVYLDPLYPSRPKDALNSKELRIVAELARGQTQPELSGMIESALLLGPSRIVVKRPQWEELLKVAKYQVTSCTGRSTRFDVIHTAQRVN